MTTTPLAADPAARAVLNWMLSSLAMPLRAGEHLEGKLRAGATIPADDAVGSIDWWTGLATHALTRHAAHRLEEWAAADHRNPLVAVSRRVAILRDAEHRLRTTGETT